MPDQCERRKRHPKRQRLEGVPLLRLLSAATLAAAALASTCATALTAATLTSTTLTAATQAAVPTQRATPAAPIARASARTS